ncbi:ferrochelatase [Kordiimonas sediminis]|uniref:Ferrochelatase n=1 Tax=Kordiimonas sediminis TaxID=1735581 RepID=A0A919AIU8_9PROT|nr:ferrochelatase [Kordiimonas sediminis]GHF11894.1 ferrochelatase [Kordiimonas sediminis]
MEKPASHPKIATPRTGLLIINLGTPEAPTYGAVRKYLAEFLGDPRVIETPRALWLPILYGPILTFRPARSAKAYAKVWNREKNESPLTTITRSQAEKLAEKYGDNVLVDWAYTYGTPSLKEKLQAMKEAGCNRIVLFALFPQYSATSTAAAYDKAFKALAELRWQPAVRTVPAYYDNADYIAALASSVQTDLDQLSWKPVKLLASYHSIPKAYWDKGDPYPCHCMKTSRLLSEKLGLNSGYLETSFQSRVGPAEWVGPYTDNKVEELVESGVTKLAVLSPAFASDCLESLEEINMELRETFLKAGGTHFHFIPCLNDSDVGMTMLKSVADQELQGWV